MLGYHVYQVKSAKFSIDEDGKRVIEVYGKSNSGTKEAVIDPIDFIPSYDASINDYEEGDSPIDLIELIKNPERFILEEEDEDSVYLMKPNGS